MRPVLHSCVALTLTKLSAIHKYKLPQSCSLVNAEFYSQKAAAGLARLHTPTLATLAQTDNPSKRLKTSMGAVDGPLAGLEPANVWGFFNELTKIPRPSKHEEKCAPSSITTCPLSWLEIAVAVRAGTADCQTFLCLLPKYCSSFCFRMLMSTQKEKCCEQPMLIKDIYMQVPDEHQMLWRICLQPSLMGWTPCSARYSMQRMQWNAGCTLTCTVHAAGC